MISNKIEIANKIDTKKTQCSVEKQEYAIEKIIMSLFLFQLPPHSVERTNDLITVKQCRHCSSETPEVLNSTSVRIYI